MRIEHLAIQNFRGIKNLDWHIGGRIICLIGPGDSTKTTILDAIELALSPSRNGPPIVDSDFYGLNTNITISIEVTVSAPPNELITEDKYGLYLRGCMANQPLLIDPVDGSMPALTVRFEVGSDLDPNWQIVKPGQREPKPIYAKIALFGMARLGEDTRRDLTWAPGSALLRITEHQRVSHASFAFAARAAAGALARAVDAPLEGAAKLAQKALTEFGVGCADLRPGVDVFGIRLTSGILALHDGDTPLRVAGLGSRRLACLAIQRQSTDERGVILIDEVEHGLEPHRIRQLLKKACPADEDSIGQVFLTTHSPTPIYHLPVDSLRFVKSQEGTTTVDRAGADIQGIVRLKGHALLARQILVCEGKTEEALCRALDDAWAPAHDEQSFAYCGVVAVDGNGRNSGPNAAIQFCRLGYDVLYLGDSDQPICPNESDLSAAGVTVVLWPDRMSTEERIATDLPMEQLDAFVKTAFKNLGDTSVLDQIGHHLGESLHPQWRNVDAWKRAYGETLVRAAIGKAAKAGGWFKDLNKGAELGTIAAGALPQIVNTPFAQSVQKIEKWVYGQ